MDILIMIFCAFAIIGILDSITGNHLKLGEEFTNGIKFIGPLALSMLGMICLVPLISRLLSPIIIPVAHFLHIDPSVFPAMLIANDMGGAMLSAELAENADIGYFNGTVIASMMGAAISFTIPTVLKTTPESKRRDVMLGILSGIATIPVGSFVSGLILRIPIIKLLINLLPIIVFSAIIAFGLIKAPKLSVAIITWFGKILFAIIMIGLGFAIIEAMTGIVIIKDIAPASESYEMFFKLAFTLSGVFPLISILSRLLKRPLAALSKKTGLDEISSLGLLSTLASSFPTFGLVEKMNRKGVVINMAFAVSAAFAIGDHLAFTVMFSPSHTAAVVIGKIVSGIAAIFVAAIVYKKTEADAR